MIAHCTAFVEPIVVTGLSKLVSCRIFKVNGTKLAQTTYLLITDTYELALGHFPLPVKYETTKYPLYNYKHYFVFFTPALWV